MKRFFKKIFQKDFNLMDSLPPLKGKVIANFSLAKKTWFGVGGNAEIYVEPADMDDLSRLLQFSPQVPITILGGGSNVLVRDGGVPGITIHLDKAFSRIKVEDDKIICGAAASLMELARVAAKQERTGFEFLSGIPGTVGGSVRMNAGAHGRSIEDVLESITVITGDGKIQEINPKETELFGYRKCYLPTNWVFVQAVFKGALGDKKEIINKMAEYKRQRENNQPVGVRTAGSTFKNPDGVAAWALIEKAGMRGVRVGGAVVSEKHANFLINTGGATAADIEELGEKIREKVWEVSGIDLEWEVKRIGNKKES